MLFAKTRTNFDGTPKTKKEILGDLGHKLEEFVDRNPMAAVAIACGTVHIAGYALLHHVTKPPTNNGKSKETTENCEF